MKRFIFILFFVLNCSAGSVFYALNQTDYCMPTKSNSGDNDYGLTLVDFVNHTFFEGLFNKDAVRKDLEGRFTYSEVFNYSTKSGEFLQRCIEQMKSDFETSEYQENIDDIILDKLERTIFSASLFFIKKEEIIPVFKEHLDKIFENNLDQKNRILAIFDENIQRILRKADLAEQINNFITTDIPVTHKKSYFDEVKEYIKKFVAASATPQKALEEYLKIKSLSDCYNPNISNIPSKKEVALYHFKQIAQNLSYYKRLISNPNEDPEFHCAKEMFDYYTRLAISAIRNPSLEKAYILDDFNRAYSFCIKENEDIPSKFFEIYGIDLDHIEKIAKRYMDVKHAFAEEIAAKFPGQFQVANVVGGGFELVKLHTATVETSTEETDSSSKYCPTVKTQTHICY